MKILYVGTSTKSDFMSDTLFHGLRNLLGNDVVDAVRIGYMYDDYPQELLQQHHGRGFTLARRLHEESIDRTDLDNKIKNRYFDYVIYGASYREDALNYLDLVSQYYPPNKIVYVNGADSHRGEIQPELIKRDGIHFLRERLIDDSSHPIAFSIPKELVVKTVPDKEYYLMPLVPGVGETYTYPDETAYLQTYQQSLFGLTWKKAGWDCLRHYEILSQGCLPLFLDIHHLPKTLMKTFPREQVNSLLDVAVTIKNYSKDMKFIYNERITMVGIDFSDIEFKDPNSYGYYDIAHKLLDHTQQYLTTEYQVKYVLDTIKQYN